MATSESTTAGVPVRSGARSEPTLRITADQTFAEAGVIWLKNHSSYIGPRTLRIYTQHLRRLNEFLGTLPIGEIDIVNIRAYQQWRIGQIKCTEMINAEINSVLAPILAEIDHWEHLTKVYKPLRVSQKITRQSMSEEQERRLLAVALDASKPRRLVAGHCLMVMCNTGMGFGELRHLKRADVFLNEEVPHVTVNEGTKNDYRIRTVPLNWIALRSMRWILKRWEELGGTSTDQYILPHHARHNASDPNRNKGTSRLLFDEPMGHIYRGARAILNEAGLDGFDPYDMRSHFGTKLLNDPQVSDQMFEELFGHASKEMRKRYSRQRIEKKAVAVSKMALDPPPADIDPHQPSQRGTETVHPALTLQEILLQPHVRAEIQGEIARQVALALQATEQQKPVKNPSRLLVFPGGIKSR